MSSTRPELKFSDVSEERNFYKKYTGLPKKPLKTIRLVDKGDYYTVIGSDAIFVAVSYTHLDVYKRQV